MMISEKEKKRRQHEKELKSFKNKLGSNIVWFDSLSKRKQYDILFRWKSEKYIKKNVTVPKRSLSYKLSKIYPANIKHYRRYKPSIVDLRQTTIDLLLNKK